MNDMATIRNKFSNPVAFDKTRHSTVISDKGRKTGAKVFVQATGDLVALRLIENPDLAEWVTGGRQALTAAEGKTA
jgi:hypothetical protein